jgi:ribokinase
MAGSVAVRSAGTAGRVRRAARGGLGRRQGARSTGQTAPVRLACFGSLNVDLALRLPHLPVPDETVLARGLARHLGGKGANQAVAAARLGGEVSMVGAVGDDTHGDELLAGLAADGVDARHVERVPGPSGLAVISVADDGQVTIAVVPGANDAVDAALARRAGTLLGAVDVLLLQGEVPVEASLAAAARARAAGALVVANPAPVGKNSERLAAAASLVVVNQGEAEALGLVPSDRVVVTLGAGGALVGDTRVAAYAPPQVVDATGAGDAFVAALAVGVASGLPLREAVQRGCAAGSWAVRHRGAQPSLPTRDQVDQVLAGG